jgi:uncharacterized protein YjbI with pentapeptide repeats
MKWLDIKEWLRQPLHIALHLLQRVHKGVDELKGYSVMLTALSASVGVLSYCHNQADREQRDYNAAWTAISASSSVAVDGGRRKALEYLKNAYKKGRISSLQGAPLANSILSYIDLSELDLNRSNMENADLFGADLKNASLWGAHIKNASLQFAQLQGADLLYADLKCADLRGAHLETGSRPTVLQQAQLEFAHLEGANLTGANLTGAYMEYAHLDNYKDIFKPDRPNVEIFDADQDSFMPAEPCERRSNGLIELIKGNPLFDSPPEDICRWTREIPPTNQHSITLPESFGCDEDRTHAKRPAANLTGADLTGAHLKNANLTGTNLTNADLTRGVGTTISQIEAAARLCNTKLPDNIPSSYSYRDCPELSPR